MKFCDKPTCTHETPCPNCQGVLAFYQASFAKIDVAYRDAMGRSFIAATILVNGVSTPVMDEGRMTQYMVAFEEKLQANLEKAMQESYEAHVKSVAERDTLANQQALVIQENARQAALANQPVSVSVQDKPSASAAALAPDPSDDEVLVAPKKPARKRVRKTVEAKVTVAATNGAGESTIVENHLDESHPPTNANGMLTTSKS